MRHIHRLLLISTVISAALWLPVTSVQAQFYHTQIIEEADGLPSPDIKSLAQDRWGLIWIASRAGLASRSLNGVNPR